ncbi:MAG: toxin-antitoxin system HicB family antitoxin [Desulfobacteraceae bacterium]|jgi:predicted HicB family RNase H-like nuclease
MYIQSLAIAYLMVKDFFSGQGIRSTVAEVVEDMISSNESIPEHLSVKKFSGKFQVRITPYIHRHLAIEAGVSLNRLISAKLAHQ